MACVAELVLAALLTKKKEARFAYVAPQYNQSKDIAWSYVKRATLDIPGVEYNESELRADLPNGARIRLYGADNPDRLRGLYLDGIILDEYADMRPSVWGEIIRPMLADRKGWAVFIGTPKGHNAFHKVWTDAGKDWFRLMVKASESGLIDRDELISAQAAMSTDQYEQEFECSFDAAILGAYYGVQMREADARTVELVYDREWPVHTAWDLGRSDDTAIWFYQVIANEIRLLEYHGSNGKDVAFYADLIKSKPYKYGLHWLPHDARAKTLASSRSVIEQLADRLDYESLRIVPNLSIQDGIQATRLMLPKCWFDRVKCEEGIEALKQYQREWDEEKKVFRDKPRHDWTSHAADAFRMLAIAYSSEPPKPKPPEPMRAIMVGANEVSLDELWHETPRRKERF